ncbi:MAG: extracellular solute-binding protein [Candidatus Kapaibacterium sp.]|jgi:multiple sugar transport system substrate-binding protein
MIPTKLRSAALYAVAACFFVLFSSCSSDSSSGEKHLRFWHFWSEPSQKQALQQLIQVFEKQNGCKVDCTELSWGDGKTKLIAAFSSHTAPDVMEFGSDWVAQFSSSGVLADMNSIQPVRMEGFAPWTTAPSYWQGKVYSLPWVVDTRVLYVNKQLLEKIGGSTEPSTWMDVLSSAEKVGGSEDDHGFGANGADGHRLYKKILPFFWSYGGDVLDKNGAPVLNSAANIEALSMYVQLSRAGLIETQKQLDGQFAQGHVAYWNSGGWLADKIGKENPLLDYTVMPLPSAKPGMPGISFAGGEYLAVSEASEQKKLALALITFLTDAKNALAFCKQVTEAGFPAATEGFHDSYFASHPIRHVFAAQLQHARMTPVHPRWLEMETVIENAVVEALYGRKEPAAALGEAQAELLHLTAAK